MASKNQGRSTKFQHAALMVYVGVCVMLIVLTVGLAYQEADSTAQLTQPTQGITRTVSPLILTQQAEGSVNDEHQGRGQEASPTAKAVDTVEATIAR